MCLLCNGCGNVCGNGGNGACSFLCRGVAVDGSGRVSMLKMDHKTDVLLQSSTASFLLVSADRRGNHAAIVNNCCNCNVLEIQPPTSILTLSFE